MSGETVNNGPIQTFTAGSTILINQLVMFATDGCVDKTVGTDGDDATVMGVALNAAVAGEPVAVRRLNMVSSIKCIANEALTVGEIVYTAADGKVTDATTSSQTIGYAKEASSADGDVIEVLVKFD